MKDFFSALLGGLLAMLGFTSCEGSVNGPTGGGMLAMYGQPYASFTVKGTVTDEAEKPVEGIKTVIDSYFEWTDDAGYEYSQLDYSDTLYTDSQGRIEKTSSIFGKGRVVVTLTDVDGPENGGKFEEQVMEGLEMKKVEDSDRAWYEGGYETEFTARLRKKD